MENDCDLPLVHLENTTGCNSSLFEVYNGLLRNFQLIAGAFYGIYFVTISLILINFALKNRKKIQNLSHKSFFTLQSRDMQFLKSNILVLIFAFLAMLSGEVYILTGMLQQEGLETSRGKLSAFGNFSAITFTVHSHLQFVPVIIQIMQITSLSRKIEETVFGTLRVVPLQILVSFFLWFFLLKNDIIGIFGHMSYLYWSLMPVIFCLGYLVEMLVKQLIERLD
eukprot:snap_masked-scaffold_49-processed-gene-1.79-mRNA-1 protein AED:1.00 eAED:1.00 QI:0/-1/0/0/-1/1/1/0/223